jgi:TonB-dependent receptor
MRDTETADGRAHLRRSIQRALSNRTAICAVSAFALTGTFSAPAYAQTNEEATEVEEIVVTGRRAALESATERKRASDAIIDSVVADEAGMLPDNSITEVVQRVSGVSIVRFAALGDPDRFSAEGSGIQVRGLSGVAGRLNGREVFSANGGRGLQWSDVTPELMQAVDVYKASTADMIEGGTGGQIDLRTKVPFDLADGLNLQISANANYGDLAKELDPGASMLLGHNWDTSAGRFGFLVDVAYNEQTQTSDFFRMEPFYRTRIGTEDRFIPGGYDYGFDLNHRTRKGAYVAIQWAPTDSFTLTQTAFYSRYDENRLGRSIFATSKDLAVDPNEAEFDSDGFLVRSNNVYQRNSANFLPSNGPIFAGGNTGWADSTSETRDLSTDFKWEVNDRLALKGAVQWVDSTYERRGYDAFPSIEFPTSFAIDLSGDLPRVSLPAGPNNLANPAVSSWQAVMDNMADNDGDLFAANLDFDFRLSDDNFFRSVEFGARYGDRSEVDLNSGFNWQALGVGWNGDPIVPFNQSPDGDVELEEWDDFFREDLNLPGATLMPSRMMAGRFDPLRDHDVYGGTAGDAFLFQPWDRTQNSTKTTAAYLLTRFDAGDRKVLGMGFKGNVGVRAVRFENVSSGFFAQNSTNTFERDGTVYTIAAVASEVSGRTETTRVLPSVNFTFLPTETMQIRLAYNVTLDQPSFNALRASGTLSVQTETINPPPAPPTFTSFRTDSGNPFLKPVISHNSDLSFEWYPSRAVSTHLGLFHKSIDNWITYGEVLQPIQVVYTSPTAETRSEFAQSTNVANAAEAATVQGFEVGGRAFFDNLPSPWNGFGVEVNYTYIDSENPGDLYSDIDGVEQSDVPVQGLSKNNYNLTAMYEKGPVSVRLAWSWRSKYLQTTNGNGTNGDYNYFSAPGTSTFSDIALPVYGDEYGQLDFGTTWRPNDNLAVSLEFNNLTNEITRTLQAGYPGGSNVRSWYVADRRANLSLRYNF